MARGRPYKYPNTATEKLCPDCGMLKPRIDFRPKSKSNPESRGYCRPCEQKRTADHHRRRYAADPDLNRNSSLRTRTGVTPSQYQALLERQGGGCAICGGVNKSGRRLAVDHDHRCCPNNRACPLCIRGLLCSNCNSAVGKLADSPDLLRRAADYLELPNLVPEVAI